MLKIGITGGIGSGKTTVAKIFEVLGVPVYYADDAAKRMMNENVQLQQQIKEVFGNAVFTDGKLDKKKLAAIVFNNPEQLEQLNKIVHPLTINDAAAWMEKQTSAYAIKEAAIIFETGSQQHLDYVIAVAAPAPLRILRTMQRDNISREEVIARMNRQLDESIRIKLSDFIIYNDEQQMLLPQVIALHEKLLLEAARK